MMAADDIVIAVSPTARDIITIDAIVQGYNELNMQVTAPDKSDRISKRSIYEIQFLKHYFAKTIDGSGNLVWIAKCSLEIPRSLLLWYRTDTKLTRREQIFTNLEAAFRFLYFHGPKVYEEYRQAWNEHAKKEDMEYNLDYEGTAAQIKYSFHRDEALQARSNALFEKEEHDNFYNMLD